MAISATVRVTFTPASGTALDQSVTISDEGGVQMEVSISADTNKEIALAFVNSRLKAIMILCAKDVTIKTNSSSSPDNTIALTANKPLLWFTGCGLANPFVAADVTKIYVTAVGAAQTLKIRMIEDATP